MEDACAGDAGGLLFINRPGRRQGKIFWEYENESGCKTWHAPVGEIIAKRDYGVTDKEILSSIRWHTIGRINMTDFEKIIFIADKIEQRTREADFREKIEKALNKRNNLDDAMLKSFKITIKSLLKRKLPICFQTIEVYNDLLEKTLK